MSWHLIGLRTRQRPGGNDFNISVGGVLYLGWIGAYLISLRDLTGRQMVDFGGLARGVAGGFGGLFHRFHVLENISLAHA